MQVFLVQKLEAFRDLDSLLRVAKVLEHTVQDQQKTIATLRAQLARLQGNDNPQLELEFLREQLQALNRRLYAPSSEKRAPQVETPEAEPAPRRGHGPRQQPLPIETREHRLEGPTTCPSCGGQLEEWKGQFEDSEEITVVEASYKLVTHRRQKYRCRCNGAVATAPGPEKLIRGGRYSPEFAVHVAESKYLDHLPLERQARMMGRKGLTIDSQTLFDQIFAGSRHLHPTYEAICKAVLAAEVGFADETHWRMMGKGSKRWYVWCLASDDAVAYWLRPSRSAEAAAGVLKGFSGILMSDGYAVYESLARAGPEVKPVHCWAHVRRKFIEAESSFPDLAAKAVEMIGRLYEVERTVPRLMPGASAGLRLNRAEALKAERQEHSRKIIDEIWSWALETRPTVLPQSSMGKAIDYMLRLWPGLKAFLEDGRIAMDNNKAERGLRGVVVGRKNHYGSRSKRGAEVAALYYTLFETAKLAGVDPHAYVLEAMRRAIAEPGTVTLPSDVTSIGSDSQVPEASDSAS